MTIRLLHDCTDKFLGAFGHPPDAQYIAVLSDIANTLTKLNTKTGNIMASLADIKQAIAEHDAAITAEIEQINQKLAELADAGTADERAQIVADLQASTARITGIIEDAEPIEPGEVEGT